MSVLHEVAPRWQSQRARFLFREINERGYDLPLASVTRDGGVEFRADLDISVWNPGDDVSSYKRVLPGDFVIGLRSFQSGLGCSPIEGLVSPAYSVLRPRRDDMYEGYFRHLLKSSLLVSRLENIAQGIRQGRTIAVEDFNELRLPVPPIATQQAIADYLDRETARIDALIGAKRRMVELLEERRVAAAHATVTGAELAGRRRSSGLPWIGTIPAHWRMARLGSLFEVQLGRMLSAERSAGPNLRDYLRNINIRWDSVDTSDLAKMDFPPVDRARYLVRTGDLLVNEGGAGIGRAAIWGGEIDEIYYQKSVHRIRPRGTLSVRWLLEWLRVAADRNVFQIEGNLATIPHVPAEALRQYQVPCPPKADADRLISALDAMVERDSAVCHASESQIALLQERRQALITATVTGQLDISEAA